MSSLLAIKDSFGLFTHHLEEIKQTIINYYNLLKAVTDHYKQLQIILILSGECYDIVCSFLKF